MKTKLLILTAVAVMCCGAGHAQPSKSDRSVEFRNHWYLQAQAGAAYTLGEGDFGDLLSPAGFVSAGYRFHPAWGLRLGVGGWQGKGRWVTPDQTYAFKFLQGNLDLTLDLNALFGGFNHRRVCSVYLLAGCGLACGFDNDEAVAMADRGIDLDYVWRDSKCFGMGRVGMGVDFRLSDCVSFNVEANAEATSDHFNSKRAGNADWQFNLLGGFSFRLGKNYRASAPAAAAAAVAAYAAAVPAEEPAAEPAAEPQQPVQLAKAEEQPVRAAVATPMVENIFFAINSDRVRDGESSKLDRLAAAMAADASLRLTVVGYADKQTGNSYVNDRLSARRAAAVTSALVARGVAADRIETAHKGDKVQPYGTAAENRVVICTAQ